MSNTKQFPNLQGKVHTDVERAIRDAYLTIYDLQSAALALRTQQVAALTPQPYSGAVNGTNASFRLSNSPTTITVFADGQLSTAYTYASGTLKLTTPPTTSLVVFGT